MSKIFVVEDEPVLCADLVDYLGAKGFTVTGINSAQGLRTALASDVPDIIVLDVGLPDGNGFELADEIRAQCGFDCGIIMLSAFGSVDHRVQGLESGADVYLVKHASLREIEATIRSVLRRITLPRGKSVAKSRNVWKLNPQKWHLSAPNGASIQLTGTEMYFVDILVRKAGDLCTRDELAQAFRRPANYVVDRNLDAVVRRLRRKIEETSKTEAPIKMVYGSGYVFAADALIVN